MKNYYEILEVTPDASQEVIKAAYKALVKRMHPDNGNIDGLDNKTIQDVNEAYEVLSDKERRAAYDSEWNQHGYERSTYASQKADVERNSEVFNIQEKKQKLVGVITASIVSIIFKTMGVPRWILIVAACCIVYCLSGLISPFIIKWINELPSAKRQWKEDDSSTIESFITLSGLKILFAVYGIDNWLTKICMFLLICNIVLVVMKIVEIIVKVDEE